MAENPDVPSLDECRALQKAGWEYPPGRLDRLWWVEMAGREPKLLNASEALDAQAAAPCTLTPAPTLGQMFAWCYNWAWPVFLRMGDCGPAHVQVKRARRSGHLPNALASAIAAALRDEEVERQGARDRANRKGGGG